MSTKQFTEATKTGYKSVGNGIKQYLYGWWLQVSRAIIALLWLTVSVFCAGVVSYVSEPVGAVVGLVVFVSLPIAYGFYKVKKDDE